MARNPADKFLQKKEPRIQATFSITKEVAENIDELAKSHDISKSDVVCGAVKMMHEISSKGK